MTALRRYRSGLMSGSGGLVAATVLIPAAVLAGAAGTPAATADPCPDIEVIFARGTGGSGLGHVGGVFVDAVRSKVSDRSVEAYSVNYPASFDFDRSAPLGASDAAARVQWMADHCPATRLVLSGISQGAGVIDLITANPGSTGRFTATPMPAQLADHVAAVAVFGNPVRKMADGRSLNEMSGLYGSKTIDLCASDDIFCSDGLDLAAHFSYVENGMVEQAADFVASRLQ